MSSTEVLAELRRRQAELDASKTTRRIFGPFLLGVPILLLLIGTAAVLSTYYTLQDRILVAAGRRSRVQRLQQDLRTLEQESVRDASWFQEHGRITARLGVVMDSYNGAAYGYNALMRSWITRRIGRWFHAPAALPIYRMP